MSPYKSIEYIKVWCWGEYVGGLVLDPKFNVYIFEYTPKWIASRVELSPLHMPLRKGTFYFPHLSRESFYGLPAMIADSLPDDFGNAVIDAWLAGQGVEKNQISALDRLSYAGDRAIGALSFEPSLNDTPVEATAIQIADIVAQARLLLAHKARQSESTHETLTQLIQVGSSAGGARAKAVVLFNPQTEQIRSGYVNAGAGFEPWILKLDGVTEAADGSQNSLESPGQFTRIEYAYYLMAMAAGVEMSECRLLNEGSRAHFITRRFDRDASGERIHQQSLCAMDQLDFRLKDTHSYSQYFNVIKNLDLGIGALSQGFRRMVFNVVAMNRDDHTKNFAFLLPKNGKWQLSPAFDVTHAFNPQGQWTQRHQMNVNSKFEGVTRSDLEIMGDTFGIPKYRTVIDEVVDAVNDWATYAGQSGVGSISTERIARAISEHQI